GFEKHTVPGGRSLLFLSPEKRIKSQGLLRCAEHTGGIAITIGGGFFGSGLLNRNVPVSPRDLPVTGGTPLCDGVGTGPADVFQGLWQCLQSTVNIDAQIIN